MYILLRDMYIVYEVFIYIICICKGYIYIYICVCVCVCVCIIIYNVICNIRGINILYPWIRDSICGNGDSYTNATFSTVGSVLRVSDAPLSLQKDT